MNYGKRSTSKKRNALISRTSMLEKRARFVYPGLIYSSDRCLRHGYLPWHRFFPRRDRRCT